MGNAPTAYAKFYEHWLARPEVAAFYEAPQDARPLQCEPCEMRKPKGLTRDLGPFKAHLKCCTFHPFLPSFTVGRLLAAEVGESFQETMLKKYLQESRLSRLGAFPRNTKPTSICETGKHDSTACAFLEKGACSIHAFRPSTCAGYVCRSSHGQDGFKAWRAWEARIARFEWSMAHLAAFELGYTLDDVDQEFSDVTEAKNYYRKAFEVALRIPFSVDDE